MSHTLIQTLAPALQPLRRVLSFMEAGMSDSWRAAQLVMVALLKGALLGAIAAYVWLMIVRSSGMVCPGTPLS
jgi:uncharacterized protein YggT (Ycf19 family)